MGGYTQIVQILINRKKGGLQQSHSTWSPLFPTDMAHSSSTAILEHERYNAMEQFKNAQMLLCDAHKQLRVVEA